MSYWKLFSSRKHYHEIFWTNVLFKTVLFLTYHVVVLPRPRHYTRLCQLTVYDVDFATLVLCAAGDSRALFGGHYAHCPQVVWTLDVGVVVGVVLGQDVICTARVQRSLDGIPAIRLVPPRNDRVRRRGSLVVTGKCNGLEEDDNGPLYRALDRDGVGRPWGREIANIERSGEQYGIKLSKRFRLSATGQL